MEHNTIVQVTKENYDELVNSGKGVVLDFWATWCMPCRMLAPVFQSVAGERPDVIFGKVDVDQEPELAARFRVMSIPTLAFLKDGTLRHTLMGVQPKEAILDAIDRM